MTPVDHDRLFKELITTFFLEFIALFLPEISAALDPDFTIVPIDKEIFTDVTRGEKHEVDVLMKAKLGFIGVPGRRGVLPDPCRKPGYRTG